MGKPAVVVCCPASERAWLKAALSGLSCSFASEEDAALRALKRAEGRSVLVWRLDPRSPLGPASLEALRARHPLTPALVLDAAPAHGDGGLLRLGGLSLLYAPFSQAAVRREVERLARGAGREKASRELFERLPAAATIVDEAGHVLDANAEARRLAGRPRPGQTCAEYWRCGVSPARCPLARAFRRGTVRRAKVPFGPAGCAIERIGAFRDEAGRRRAVIITGPATAYFKRQRRLRREAEFDALSCVHNRRSFDAMTARALRVERRRHPAAFLMLDIDGLKAVNDLFGHAAGDAVIARLGAVLVSCARREDVVGRIGGDEFALYCAGISAREARALSVRIQDAVAADNRARPDQPRLSVSIGVACSSRGGRADLREAADRCLRRRKEAARIGRPGRREKRYEEDLQEP